MFPNGVRFQKNAVVALQEGAEAYLVGLMRTRIWIAFIARDRQLLLKTFNSHVAFAVSVCNVLIDEASVTTYISIV